MVSIFRVITSDETARAIMRINCSPCFVLSREIALIFVLWHEIGLLYLAIICFSSSGCSTL